MGITEMGAPVFYPPDQGGTAAQYDVIVTHEAMFAMDTGGLIGPMLVEEWEVSPDAVPPLDTPVTLVLRRYDPAD